MKIAVFCQALAMIPLALFVAADSSPAEAAPAAGEIIQATGVEAGLAVHVGTTDGVLEAELTNGGRMLVQGLALTDAATRTAREHLFAEGLYGLAAVSRVASTKTLPCYDRVVNLLVADLDDLGAQAPSTEEIHRVLGYEGVAYLKQGGKWTKVVSSTPPEVDAWTHARYDATRSATSKDLIVGPPNAMRWLGGLCGRASMSGPRTSDGVFLQYAPAVAEPGSRSAHYVWARDVNSGVLLWRREVSPVMPVTEYTGWSDYCVGDLFVAAGGRVYTYDLTQDTCALTAFNIRTGEIARVFDKSAVIRKEIDPRSNSLVLSRDVLRALTRSTVAVEGGMVIQLFDKKLYVMNAKSGEVLWKREPSDGSQYRHVVAGNGRLIALRGEAEELVDYKTSNIFFLAKALECYDLENGKPRWTFTDFGAELEVMNDLFCLSGDYLPLVGAPRQPRGQRGRPTVTLLDVNNGKVIWNEPLNVKLDHQRQRHLRILGEDLWYHPWPSTSSGVCIDLLTRETKRKVSNHRGRGCSGHVATPNYLILQKSFHPLGEGADVPEATQYYTLRCFNPYCGERINPSYGSVYCLLSICPCESYIPGSAKAFYQVMPFEPVPDRERLEKPVGVKGFGSLPRQTPQQTAVAAMDWRDPGDIRVSTRRYPGGHPDRQRFGSGCSGVAWTGYTQQTTQPLKAGELSLVAYVHEHLLQATRGDQPLWDFVAGGRISSAPVIHKDLALFGCHDGYVYAVKLSDGSLAWRFLAAPADRRHVVFGQFESAWPVFNVALDKGKAYFAAGRHGDLDGGIHVYCVDAATGTLQWHAKYLRGLTTDKNTRFNVAPEGHEGKIGKNKERWNSYVINDPIEVRNGKIYIRAEFPDPGWDAEKGTRLPAEHLARLKFPYERVQAGKQPGLLRYPEGELTLIDDINDPHDTIINPETLAPPRRPTSAARGRNQRP